MLNETAIMITMNNKTFGLRESASIVGGMSRLQKLLVAASVILSLRDIPSRLISNCFGLDNVLTIPDTITAFPLDVIS